MSHVIEVDTWVIFGIVFLCNVSTLAMFCLPHSCRWRKYRMRRKSDELDDTKDGVQLSSGEGVQTDRVEHLQGLSIRPGDLIRTGISGDSSEGDSLIKGGKHEEPSLVRSEKEKPLLRRDWSSEDAQIESILPGLISQSWKKENREPGKGRPAFTVHIGACDGDGLFRWFKLALQQLDIPCSEFSLRAMVAKYLTEADLQFLKEVSCRREAEPSIFADYAFMRGVRTLADLKLKVCTLEYWGDELAIRALQAVTGLHVFVLVPNAKGEWTVAHHLLNESSMQRPDMRFRTYITLVLRCKQYFIVASDGALTCGFDGLLPMLQDHLRGRYQVPRCKQTQQSV